MRGVGLMVASVFRSEDLELFLDLFCFQVVCGDLFRILL